MIPQHCIMQCPVSIQASLQWLNLLVCIIVICLSPRATIGTTSPGFDAEHKEAVGALQTAVHIITVCAAHILQALHQTERLRDQNHHRAGLPEVKELCRNGRAYVGCATRQGVAQSAPVPASVEELSMHFAVFFLRGVQHLMLP